LYFAGKKAGELDFRGDFSWLFATSFTEIWLTFQVRMM